MKQSFNLPTSSCLLVAGRTWLPKMTPAARILLDTKSPTQTLPSWRSWHFPFRPLACRQPIRLVHLAHQRHPGSVAARRKHLSNRQTVGFLISRPSATGRGCMPEPMYRHILRRVFQNFGRRSAVTRISGASDEVAQGCTRVRASRTVERQTAQTRIGTPKAQIVVSGPSRS